jgi:hypothetical protein
MSTPKVPVGENRPFANFSRKGFLSSRVQPIQVIQVSLPDDIESPREIISPIRIRESQRSWDDVIYAPPPLPTWDPSFVSPYGRVDDAVVDQCDESFGGFDAYVFQEYDDLEGVEIPFEDTVSSCVKPDASLQTKISRRVAFACSSGGHVRVSEYSVQPYAEVYGVHPRYFDFDADGNKLPRTGPPFIAAARCEVHPSRDTYSRQPSMGFMRHDEFEYDNIF